jgi:hypothetical protein
VYGPVGEVSPVWVFDLELEPAAAVFAPDYFVYILILITLNVDRSKVFGALFGLCAPNRDDQKRFWTEKIENSVYCLVQNLRHHHKQRHAILPFCV